jgi:hypothetical protein
MLRPTVWVLGMADLITFSGDFRFSEQYLNVPALPGHVVLASSLALSRYRQQSYGTHREYRVAAHLHLALDAPDSNSLNHARISVISISSCNQLSSLPCHLISRDLSHCLYHGLNYGSNTRSCGRWSLSSCTLYLLLKLILHSATCVASSFSLFLCTILGPGCIRATMSALTSHWFSPIGLQSIIPVSTVRLCQRSKLEFAWPPPRRLSGCYLDQSATCR